MYGVTSIRSPSSESKESTGVKSSVGKATAACSVCSSAIGVVEGERCEEVEASRLGVKGLKISLRRDHG